MPEMKDETRGHTRRGPVLAAGCFSMAVLAMSSVVLSALLQPISRVFNRDLAECGILLVYAPAGFMVSTLVSGYLSERWGQRVFVLMGFSGLATGLVLAASAASYSILCVGLFLMGLSGGFIESPISAVTADAFPERRAQVLNFVQIFFNVGAIVGPAVAGGILWLGWGWRGGFGYLVVMAVAAFAFCLYGLPSMKGRRAAPAAASVKQPIRWGVVLAMAFAIFLYVGSEMTMAQWAAKYLSRTFDVSEPRAPLVVSGFWMGMMFGRALYVVIVGRWGYFAPLLLSAVLSAAAAMAAAVAPSAGMAAAACCLAGFFYGGSWPTILGYAAHKSPGRTGTIFGILVSAGAAGSLVFLPISGWVAELSDYKVRAVMMQAAVTIFVEGAVIFGVWLWERHSRNS